MAVFKLKGTGYLQTAYQFVPGQADSLMRTLRDSEHNITCAYTKHTFHIYYKIHDHSFVSNLTPWDWVLIDEQGYPFHVDTDDDFNYNYE